MSIADNIARIEERIQKACDVSGRKRSEITLMGVSKFEPVNKAEEAFRSGIRCFGESRVKEAVTKFENFRDEYPAALHLIGSLQRNKAKQAALFFDCVQSVDRLELIHELVKHSAGRETPLEILLELHTGEESKSGFSDFDGLFKAAQSVLESGNLKPLGLMTMAPFTADKDIIRSSFRRLVKAQGELEKRFPSCKMNGSWVCLSMGMSNDFETAVEEGSTMLRIGSLIFKE
ncbi:MAG: YggS family pyridoxal phosphate-dependent enzyme [Treponema sp.]|nr:YggS family pyridoxal phosphate-dependent enzyme [Treponema sp.]